MSDTEEKEETGQELPVDASNNGKPENDHNKQNNSPNSGDSGPVQETPNPAENGEVLPNKTDVEMTADDNTNVEVEPLSISQQSDRDLPPPSVTINGGDEQLVKLDIEPLKEEGEQLVKPDTESLKDDGDQLVKQDTEPVADAKSVEAQDLPQSNSHGCEDGNVVSTSLAETAKPTVGVKNEVSQVPEQESGDPVEESGTVSHKEPVTPHAGSSDIKADSGSGEELKNKVDEKDITTPKSNGTPSSKGMFLLDDIDSDMYEGNGSGTEEEQSVFMKEVENFFKERNMEFKPPKFYGEGLNCLKLWRGVTRLGGYDKVTSNKLWRQVGEAFRPPKTCTTVSWTFRGFYEKALLDYERHKFGTEPPISSLPEPMNIDNQSAGSGRARRDAAARAMQGWHSQRITGSGEVSDPIIKDKNAISLQKREKQLKSIGSLKRKKPPFVEHVVKAARTKESKLDVDVVDLGPPADWVKINVQRTKDCFEVYALVPGLLREEVRVQSDPAGRLVISGEPEHPDNPWGVTAFKKVVTLPSRIDPHQTSAVVTLHGQLFVRVPFEQSDQ